MKVTTGSADDWPAVGIATVLDAEGDMVKSASIVVSAATTKATRIVGAEALLSGKKIDDKILDDAAEATVAECEILSDVRGSVSYKRELMRVYFKRAVRSALEGKMGVH
jgi:carbon-monoxide dehydrogenase medium subunit